MHGCYPSPIKNVKSEAAAAILAGLCFYQMADTLPS
jgi:hypothetical protein